MSSASGTASEAAASVVASTASAKDRLSLEVIIGKFSSPLTEEHAWAIVYEALKCLENLLRTYSVRFGGASGQQVTDKLTFWKISKDSTYSSW